jgi:hypothetical protein
MNIVIIKEAISRKDLESLAKEGYGNFVKAVVDVQEGIIAIGGEFHSEEEACLMSQEGSKREHTWGINLYPNKQGEDFIEFDSMVNLKPSFGNRSRGVENEQVRAKIKEIIQKFIQE